MVSIRKYPMITDKTIIERDLKHIWHPCSQMKEFEKYPPFVVHRAQGSHLYTDRGPVIDAISSWWCKSLGHGHPAVISAIQSQLTRFEHVIGANSTHALIVELAEELHAISGKQHVFFASDGSSAVEIAMKLAIHAMSLKGTPERRDFIALQHGYHGETLGTLSISDVGIFKTPFNGFGVDCHILNHIPYVSGQNDPLWQACGQDWEKTLKQLEAVKHQSCAIILEPIVQGAGGMRCYSADFLTQLRHWASTNGIYFIADEIMTGMGRTGQWLACDHAGVQADMSCLSKGLTSGSLPLSCVLIDHDIYSLFYDDMETGKSFLHSHTYSGNALAVSAALATIRTMRAEHINQQAIELGHNMTRYLTEIAKETGVLSQVRSVGAFVAADLIHSEQHRLGHHIAQTALNKGALLRPIGNTLYWLPPLTTDSNTLERLAQITQDTIKTVYGARHV